MRLLRCFTKKTVVLTTVPEEATRPPAQSDARESDAESRVDEKQKMTMSSDRLTFSPGSPSSFVPTSIPELHPEYAHSEPYCFVPRTESARIVVDRVRGARGQPSLDRANILKEQGLVVVRGPSACAPAVSSPDTTASATGGPLADGPPACPPSPIREPLSSSTIAKSPPRTSVPLKVEIPSTADNTFVDSDDEPVDENANVSNIPSSVENTPTRVSKGTPSSRSKRSTGNMSFRLKGRNRKTSRSTKGSQRSLTSPILMQPNTTQEHALESDDCTRAGDDTDQRITKRNAYGRSPSDVPAEPRASQSNTNFEEVLQRAMDHTPQELLAPIVVPRTSVVFGEGLIVSPNATPTKPSTVSPRSKESSDSQQFVDAEETPMEPNMPSPLPSPPPSKPTPRTQCITGDNEGPSSPTTLHSIRSRRKSKPFPPHGKAPSEEPSTEVRLSPIPAPQPLSREPSLGMLSDGAEDDDENADNGEGGKVDSLFPVRSPTSGAASRQRSEIPIDVSSYSRIQPARSALARRAAVVGKRKTVSFHDAAPVIIEPDLRAPSLSVPRSVALAKDSPVESQQSIGTALWRARDSVTWCRPSIPLVDIGDDDDDEGNSIFGNDTKREVAGNIVRDDVVRRLDDLSNAGMNLTQHKVVKDGNTVKTSTYQVKVTGGGNSDDNLIRVGQNSSLDNAQEIRKRSDLSNASKSDASLTSSENSFRGRSSVRLSKMDKAGIQEATRRQSLAVAKAMSEQIRGVPRSAMLAYTENEVVFEEDEMKTIEDEDRVTVDGFRSTPSWHGRSSRNAFKSIRVPVFKENEVPPPPPPPPFQPRQLNTRSMRAPPPPPKVSLARK